MGTMKTLPDSKIKRWPYRDDGQWKMDNIRRFNPRSCYIGAYPGSRTNNAKKEYEAKYGFKISAEEFTALQGMTRFQRRRWCIARRAA